MTVSSSCSSPVPVERLQRGALGFSSSAASSKCECECRTDTKKLQSRVGIRCLCEPRLQPTLGNEIRMPSGIQYTEAGCQVLHLPFQEIHTFCQYCTTLWPIVYIHWVQLQSTIFDLGVSRLGEGVAGKSSSSQIKVQSFS
jgi:hypothetical protein